MVVHARIPLSISRVKKSFYAPYVEAVFQIWWRSVHEWRHNRGDGRGDRTRQMILYSVQCCYA